MNLKVRSGLKAGGFIIIPNHSRAGLKVRSSVRAGGIDVQHSRRVLRAR
jgi:hypothetical protein